MNVYKHRQAMGIADLTVGWDDRLEDAACQQNPHWGCYDDSAPLTLDTPLAVLGRELWGLLHAFAQTFSQTPTEEDVSNARYWMSAWRQRIPQFGGCNCREDWARLEANFPPDYSSRDAFYRWSVVAHDAINRKLSKPIWNPEWLAAANLGGF